MATAAQEFEKKKAKVKGDAEEKTGSPEELRMKASLKVAIELTEKILAAVNVTVDAAAKSDGVFSVYEHFQNLPKA